MKRVVLKDEQILKDIKDVQIGKCYIYVSEAGTLYVLSKLGYKYVDCRYGRYHYGFLPLGKTASNPVFLGDYIEDAIKKALRSSRNVLEFNNISEAVKWKLGVTEEYIEPQDKDFVVSALNAYWNDAQDQLTNGGHLASDGSRIPLGDIERENLIKQQQIAKRLMNKMN